MNETFKMHELLKQIMARVATLSLSTDPMQQQRALTLERLCLNLQRSIDDLSVALQKVGK